MKLPIDIIVEFPLDKPITFNKEYFTQPGFKERFLFGMKLIRSTILEKKDQATVKRFLNAFIGTSFQLLQDKKIEAFMHLENLKTLMLYAEVYENEQTFENIVKAIESEKLKNTLFSKHPLEASLVYGDALLKYYVLKNKKYNGWYSDHSFQTILKAKYFIFKVYTQYIEGKNRLSESDFNYCLVLLAGCFTALSRWCEPFYFLNSLNGRDQSNPNLNYLFALNLDGLKDRCCLDYNGQLLLKIVQCTSKTIESDEADIRQIEHAKEMKENSLKAIETAKLSIGSLRKHRTKVENSKIRRNKYFKYCISNDLFLNEHGYFCSCGRSIGDNLVIETSHAHTKIRWTDNFQIHLDTLVSEYEIARQNLFQGDTEISIGFNYKAENRRPKSKDFIRDSRIKNSFRICYSILDQIASGIFNVRGIDIDKHLQSTNPNAKIYFLNMWDLYHFSESDFNDNLYLVSLLSIAKDLDRSDYAALKSFKNLRNAMEHKMLFTQENVGEKEEKMFADSTVLSRAELLEKSKTLLRLTKSAIISYCYLIRRESKLIEIRNRKNSAESSTPEEAR